MLGLVMSDSGSESWEISQWLGRLSWVVAAQLFNDFRTSCRLVVGKHNRSSVLQEQHAMSLCRIFWIQNPTEGNLY